MSKLYFFLVLGILCLLSSSLDAALQTPPGPSKAARIEGLLRTHLTAMHKQQGFPGVSAAFVLPTGEQIAVAVGFDSEREGTPLTTKHKFLSGSIGKTYVTAAAHHWLQTGKLKLDDKALKYLGKHEWWKRMPNAESMTVLQLLRHETGLPRYIFAGPFWADLLKDPDRVWTPKERLAFVFDQDPLFPAGEGWAYADTNYIVVGMIIEELAGHSFYDDVTEMFIKPLQLQQTVPTNTRTIANMVQGHVVACRQFGYGPETLVDGVFHDNIQFEWCGGGWASTPLDLARWAGLLYSGKAMQGEYLDTLLDHVPAPELGPGIRYGLGVMVEETDNGLIYGHEGFMPGYLSAAGWMLDSNIAGAVQFNIDDSRKTGKTSKVLQQLMAIVIAEL